MTQCNRKPLTFSTLFRRRVEADFDGGHLTSDAGGLLLREVDRRLGLTDRLAACIHDRRDPATVTHSIASMLRQRLFGEVAYAAETWDRRRRVLVKAEHLAEGANTRFVVTRLAGDPQDLYDRLYCARGDMENRIKEQQMDLFADRTSCPRFLANQFRLLLASAAYVLVEMLRREGLAGTERAHAQAGTIRTKLLKVGARVCVSVRRVVLHLASGYPWQRLFRHVLERLRCLPCLRLPLPPAVGFR